MSTATVEPPLPRADVPGDAQEAKGFFAFGDTSLKGLDFVFWALLLYLFVCFTGVDEEWPQVAKFRPRLLLGVLVLLVATVRIVNAAFQSEEGPAPPDAVSAWWGGYMLATLFATLWAYDFGMALGTLLDGRLQSLLLFPLLVALVRTRRQLLIVILVFSLAHGFYLLRSFQEYFNGRIYAKAEGARMVGMGARYADPNSFAAVIAFSLPLVLWAGLHTRSWFLRFCVLCYYVLGVVAVVNTKSRSGFVLLGLATLWFVTALPTRRARTVAVVVLLLASAVGYTLVPERTLTRYRGMVSAGATESDRESTMGRIEGYQVSAKIFKENPVFGVGPGNFSIYRLRKIDGDSMMPHNLAGLLLATLGLAGTVTFAGYLLAVFWRGVRERRRRRASADPWERALRQLIGAVLFTLFLLLVSGVAAHNVGRELWYMGPALIVAGVTCRLAAPSKDPMEREPA